MFVMPLHPYAPVWGVCVPVSPVSWEPRASGGPRVIPSNDDDGLATRLHRQGGWARFFMRSRDQRIPWPRVPWRRNFSPPQRTELRV